MLCNFSLLFTCIALLCDLVWIGKDLVKPAKVFLGVIPSLQHVSHTTYFGKVDGKFAGGKLNPTVLVTGKDVTQRWSQYQSLGNDSSLWSLPGHKSLAAVL